jgi:hypothetical protein
VAGKQKPGSTAPSSEAKQKPEERRWRPAVWLGGRKAGKNILPAIWGPWPATEKKNIAGEMGCVAGKREKKIIYRRPARWGAWPAREKKNYISPAGEMGCVAGERKKKLIMPAGEMGCVAGERKKKLYIPAGEIGCVAGKGKKI